MRRIPNINEELRRLDDAINNKLITSFTENKLCGNDERLLLSLPTNLGEMGLPVFSEIANIEFQHSPLLTCTINSATRKDLRNSKRNYNQHQEENQTR